MLKIQPDEISLCNLEVVCMPNGDIICLGKIIGQFKNLKNYLEKKGKENGKEN